MSGAAREFDGLPMSSSRTSHNSTTTWDGTTDGACVLPPRPNIIVPQQQSSTRPPRSTDVATGQVSMDGRGRRAAAGSITVLHFVPLFCTVLNCCPLIGFTLKKTVNAQHFQNPFTILNVLIKSPHFLLCSRENNRNLFILSYSSFKN
jgi:hypothetical protein